MSGNAKRQKRPGARVVDAPTEFGFTAGDTPKPGAVAGNAAGGPDRWRRLWGAVKLAFGMTAVVCASLAIAWGAHRFAITTPRFAIASFAVEGNRRTSDDRVVRAAGLEKGKNIFQVDLDAAERTLLADPWVESVRVTRHLPGRIEIELRERQATALALIASDLYVLDDAGLPFKRLAAGDPHDLPVVTGLTADGMALDRTRELERAKHAIEVLRVYDTLPLARVYPAQEVHLEVEGSTVLQVGKEGMALLLGRSDWRRKLAMAARVVGKAQVQGAPPGIVFLDNEAHEERVVVRMR